MPLSILAEYYVMSTLNLALMNIALARNELPQDQERLIHNKKTLTEVREVIARHPEVNKALVDSMQQVLCTLSQRLSSMEVKREPIGITQACSDNDMKLFWEQLSVIQPNLSYENMNKKVLSEPANIQIQQFMASHCSITKYLFQVKKCLVCIAPATLSGSLWNILSNYRLCPYQCWMVTNTLNLLICMD